MTVLSIPDRKKVSKEEWEAYLSRLASTKPTAQQIINYNLLHGIKNI